MIGGVQLRNVTNVIEKISHSAERDMKWTNSGSILMNNDPISSSELTESTHRILSHQGLWCRVREVFTQMAFVAFPNISPRFFKQKEDQIDRYSLRY